MKLKLRVFFGICLELLVVRGFFGVRFFIFILNFVEEEVLRVW